MRWPIDLIRIIGSVLACVGLWTVALAVKIAIESKNISGEKK